MSTYYGEERRQRGRIKQGDGGVFSRRMFNANVLITTQTPKDYFLQQSDFVQSDWIHGRSSPDPPSELPVPGIPGHTPVPSYGLIHIDGHSSDKDPDAHATHLGTKELLSLSIRSHFMFNNTSSSLPYIVQTQPPRLSPRRYNIIPPFHQDLILPPAPTTRHVSQANHLQTSLHLPI